MAESEEENLRKEMRWGEIKRHRKKGGHNLQPPKN